MTKAPCGYKPTPDNLKRLYRYTFETSTGLQIECFLEYEEEERAAYDNPGCAEQITLVYALVEGVDISEVIAPDTALTIEEEAMADIDQKAKDYNEDAAIARYEDRMAA